jgi:hypothetical protein
VGETFSLLWRMTQCSSAVCATRSLPLQQLNRNSLRAADEAYAHARAQARITALNEGGDAEAKNFIKDLGKQLSSSRQGSRPKTLGSP